MEDYFTDEVRGLVLSLSKTKVYFYWMPEWQDSGTKLIVFNEESYIAKWLLLARPFVQTESNSLNFWPDHTYFEIHFGKQVVITIPGNDGSLITVYIRISIPIDNIEANVEITATGVEKGNKQLQSTT